MPHVPRILDPDGHYHLTNRGNNRATIFRDEADYLKYVELLRTFKARTPFVLHHYALMPNHVHLQMRALPGQSLSEIMKRISHAYAMHCKRRYGFIGHVWQGRFKCKRIDTDAYMLASGIYIELNPVRGGIVTDPLYYPWSSVRSYLTADKDPLIDFDPEFLALGATHSERIAAYRALVKMWMSMPRPPKR